VVIANPRAGRGKVGAALPRVERVLRDEGLDYRGTTPVSFGIIPGVIRLKV
jgi:hypothetical protein